MMLGIVGAMMLAAGAAPHGQEARSAPGAPLATAGLPVLRSGSELPPSSFVLREAPSRAFMGDAFLRETVPLLRAEAERVRGAYRIEDSALADQIRSGLIAIAILQGRPADADRLIAESRAAATKPQQRAIGFLLLDAMAGSGSAAGDAGCAAGAARIASRLEAGEAAVLRDDALARLTQTEVMSPPFIAGIFEAEMDPGARQRGHVTLLEALRLASFRAQIAGMARCRAAYAAAIRAWVAAPGNRPTDIWAAREPDARLLAGAAPVTVAIWDGGYDSALFDGQLAIDPEEPLDGRDNDGNGVVDDWNGPTYDPQLAPMAAPLARASAELAPQLAYQMALFKGNGDLLAGLSTAEGALFAQRSREASQADQAMDSLLYDEVGSRSHGTMVASEIADGAPFVRLYNVAALPFSENPRPVPMDEAQVARWVKAIDAIGPRLRGAGVRIVNMSWGTTADEIAERLLRTGSETDQAKAAARGKAMFAQADAALRRLIARSPGILFVASAGNSNQTDEILAAVPQTIAAPNLIVVGASGTNGLPTGFTTFGKGVGIYAWGQNVPLRVPGGLAMTGSGTSMAAPLVARAAATMLAVRPALTPAQLIAGLTATATPGADGLKLLHPGEALRWARAR